MERKNKGLIALVVFLVIVVIGLGLYICYDKGIIFAADRDDSNREVQKEQENNTSKDAVETEMNDNYAIKDINRKVNAILSLGRDANNDTRTIQYNNFYLLGLNDYVNYSDDNKLFTALNSDSNHFRAMTAIDVQNVDPTISSRFDNMASGFTVYEAAKINETYQELFGTDANHKDIENCPQYLYDSKSQVYYYSSACGGTGRPNNIGYIYRYTQKGDEAYAYFVLGTMDVSGDIYTDLYMKEQETPIPTKYEKSLTNYTIDETNYTDFTKYKMTFKQNVDGTYYFSKFEKDVS